MLVQGALSDEDSVSARPLLLALLLRLRLRLRLRLLLLGRLHSQEGRTVTVRCGWCTPMLPATLGACSHWAALHSRNQIPLFHFGHEPANFPTAAAFAGRNPQTISQHRGFSIGLALPPNNRLSVPISTNLLMRCISLPRTRIERQQDSRHRVAPLQSVHRVHPHHPLLPSQLPARQAARAMLSLPSPQGVQLIS